MADAGHWSTENGTSKAAPKVLIVPTNRKNDYARTPATSVGVRGSARRLPGVGEAVARCVEGAGQGKHRRTVNHLDL